MPLTRDEQRELVHLIQKEKEAQNFYDGAVQWRAGEEKLTKAAVAHDGAFVALLSYIESLVEK